MEVNEAITDFAKGDIQDIVAGVEVLMKVLSQLPGDLKNCKEIEPDLKRIENWIG